MNCLYHIRSVFVLIYVSVVVFLLLCNVPLNYFNCLYCQWYFFVLVTVGAVFVVTEVFVVGGANIGDGC